MGKRLIVQARGRGGPRYKIPSHRYLGRIDYLPSGNFTAKVVDIVSDAIHLAPIMVVKTEDGKKILQIAPEGVQAGDFINYGSNEANVGNVIELSKVPVGTRVFGIETYTGSGPKLCRSSGSYALVAGVSGNNVTLQLTSGKEKILDGRCRATIGVPAGGGRLEKPYYKVGQKWHAMTARGKLFPRTAGVAMTPTDHPYGGRKKSAKFKTISRHAPPGRKIGSIAARRSGKPK
ncbi:MAG: 50S ribosomal protein L2 [Candidatus Aenigmarchaeota archaeon]|nr:50S ribosomal protein L2 [Candidatus Aenigmarchaeota archaeon]